MIPRAPIQARTYLIRISMIMMMIFLSVMIMIFLSVMIMMMISLSVTMMLSCMKHDTTHSLLVTGGSRPLQMS